MTGEISWASLSKRNNSRQEPLVNASISMSWQRTNLEACKRVLRCRRSCGRDFLEINSVFSRCRRIGLATRNSTPLGNAVRSAVGKALSRVMKSPSFGESIQIPSITAAGGSPSHETPRQPAISSLFVPMKSISLESQILSSSSLNAGTRKSGSLVVSSKLR